MSSSLAQTSIDLSPRETDPLDDEVQEQFFTKRSGCCLWLPCFRSGPSSSTDSIWWERMRTVAEKEDPWWFRGWKKVREWSELTAGPKWKTFIRRFNKSRHGTGGYKPANVKFAYDPISYARNFDEGPRANGDLDNDYLNHSFSCRFASVPASAKSSMDVGKDGPSFTWLIETWRFVIGRLWFSVSCAKEGTYSQIPNSRCRTEFRGTVTLGDPRDLNYKRCRFAIEKQRPKFTHFFHAYICLPET